MRGLKKMYIILLLAGSVSVSSCARDGSVDEKTDTTNYTQGEETSTKENTQDKEPEKKEAFVKTFSEEDVIFDNDSLFVKNEILLMAEDDYAYADIEKYVREHNGQIVGYIPVAEEYQVELNIDGNSNIHDIIDEFNAAEQIQFASLNYVSIEDTAAIEYQKDTWDQSADDWNVFYPKGSNWWAEMTMAPMVWGSDKLSYSDVRVGVIDSCFDEKQVDLKNIIKKTWNNDTYRFYEENGEEDFGERNHGTHVAGLIAAEAGNNYGVAGVASAMKEKLSLFCYSMDGGKGVKSYVSLMDYKYALSLMLSENVKVINISMGWRELQTAAGYGIKKAVEDLLLEETSMEKFLLQYHNKGYEFLICKSAGNNNGYKWLECEVSKEHPYGIRIQNEDDKNVDDKRISVKTSVKYDIFGGIKNELVKQHIITVGAGEYNAESLNAGGTGMIHASYSSFDSDVYAPGGNTSGEILSIGFEEESVYMCGTSMATPIVSGTAALVWGVNPKLSSKEVKDILIESATTNIHTIIAEISVIKNIFKPDYTKNDIHYINIADAVGKAAERRDKDAMEKTSVNVDSMLMVEVYSKKQTNGKEEFLPEKVAVTVNNTEGTTIHLLENETGIYTGFVPQGSYSMVVSGDDMEDYTCEIEIDELVEYKKVEIEKKEKIVDVSNYIGSKNEFDISNFIQDLNIADEIETQRYEDGMESHSMYSDEKNIYVYKAKNENGAWMYILGLSDQENKEYSFYGISIGENYKEMLDVLASYGALYVASENSELVCVKFVPHNNPTIQWTIYLNISNEIITYWDAWNIENGGVLYYDFRVLLEEAKADKSDWEPWRQEYIEIIKKNVADLGTNMIDFGTIEYSYLLKDIDGNGVPELIVSQFFDMYPFTSIYFYDKGKMYCEPYDKSFITVIGDNNLICVEGAARYGAQSIAFFELKGSKFEMVAGGYSELNREFEYYWNDKKVSAETYSSKIEKLRALGKLQGTDMSDVEAVDAIIHF